MNRLGRLLTWVCAMIVLVLLCVIAGDAHAFGRRRSEPVAVLDATTHAVGAGEAGTTPGGFSFARADTATCATVQTGTSTVSAAIAANTPRYGRALDADPVALVIEPTRTQVFPFPRNPSNAAIPAGSGDTYTSGQASPDGTTNAYRVQVTSTTGFTKNTTISGQSGTWTMSTWVRQGSGSGVYQGWIGYSNGSWFATSVRGTAATAWARAVSSPLVMSGTFQLVEVPGDGRNAIANGLTNEALDYVSDYIQMERGAWASDAITTDSTKPRAGERLWYSTGAALIDAGRVSVYVSTQMKHTPANADSAMRVWTIDASNFVSIATTGVMTLEVGGLTNTTNALSWAAGDVVEMWVATGGSTASVVKYRLNGGAVTTLTITGSALGTISGSSVDVLCNGAANQAGQRLRGVQFFRTAGRPGWAA